MPLRTRLLATYLVFVAALFALGAWSAWRLEEVGAVSQRILSENYESVVAAQAMKESLERQDSAALFAELGRAERARRRGWCRSAAPRRPGAGRTRWSWCPSSPH